MALHVLTSGTLLCWSTYSAFHFIFSWSYTIMELMSSARISMYIFQQLLFFWQSLWGIKRWTTDLHLTFLGIAKRLRTSGLTCYLCWLKASWLSKIIIRMKTNNSVKRIYKSLFITHSSTKSLPKTQKLINRKPKANLKILITPKRQTKNLWQEVTLWIPIKRMKKAKSPLTLLKATVLSSTKLFNKTTHKTTKWKHRSNQNQC